MPSHASASFLAFPLCLAALAAQGTYYVDGVAGLDAPGRGASPTAPWRTIGYAAANAVGTTASPATIQVLGGQTYASSTNGESYPVTLPPQVQLVGVAANGSLPVLTPTATATALRFDPAVAHANGATTHRRIVVQGGAVGLDVGAAIGVSHVAVFEDCEFHDQTSAGVLATSRGGAIALTVRNCLLDGPGTQGAAGLHNDLSGPAPSQAVTIQGCTIRNWSYGARSGSNGTVYWSSTMTVSDTTVANCDTGLLLGAPFLYGPANTANAMSTTVARVQVTDCNLGINMVTPPGQAASYSVAATDVAVMRCTTGIQLACVGNSFSGQSFQSTWLRATVAQCATGLNLYISNNAVMTHFFEQSDFLSNVDGISCQALLGDYRLNLRRCRVLDGSQGVALVGSSLYTGQLFADDCLIARQSTRGVYSASCPVYMQRSTVADCGIGIIGSYMGGTAGGCLFSGNTSDVQAINPPSVSFSVYGSATDGAALPSGWQPNFQFASVGLQRPNYKLAPNSPCIVSGGSSSGLFDYEGDPRGNADIGADEYVAAGSLRTYGLRSVGDVAASPAISTTSTSAPIGGSYQIDLAGAAAPGATTPSLAVLVTGLRDTAAPLPVELGPVGLPNCLLHLDPVLLQTMPPTSASGALSTSFALPNQPNLVGFVLCHQWLVGLPTPDGFVTSDALRVTVGQ